jgi:cyclopropane fatty-acyl-phospholipid synthase-like methyltransferase
MNSIDSLKNVWETWHADCLGPRYPHEKVIQFSLRNFQNRVLRQDAKVLDVGCGAGADIVFFAQEGFDVYGIDIAPSGLSFTKTRLDGFCLNANLKLESADVLEFPNEYFDLIVSVGVYQYLPFEQVNRSISRISKILKQNGKGLFVFASDKDVRSPEPQQLNKGYHGYTRNEIKQIFEGKFAKIEMDRYITTYENEKYEHNDWLVTVHNL